MAISNTSIQIRRSTTTGVPSSGTLKAGEIAYSYTSNTLFLGTSGGNAVVNIGGSYYTTTLDAATSSNTASTLVKRDPTGTFSGNLIGSSSNTFTLVNPQNFSITGDVLASAVSFNGSSAVALSSALNTINPNVGTFGSTTAVPVITVTGNGRITSVTTSTIATSFNISDGTNSAVIPGGTTFNNYGSKGITTTVSANTVTIGTDTTVARTNTSNIGAQVFNTDVNLPTNNMSVGGTLTVSNLAVSGNITYANSISTLNIGDPIIYLASNNSGNLVDIGMVGHFVGTGHSGDTSHYQHTGFVRDYNDNKWKLFSNVSTEPTTTVNFAEANTVYDVIKTGGLDASNGNITFVNSISAGSLSLTTPLGISSGGTNGSSFTNNQITYFNGTSIVSLANSTYSNTGTYGTNTTLAGLTVDGFGRVTAASWQPISGLTVSQGGTGQSSFTSGQIIVGSGTNGLAQLANTGIISFTETSNSTITSVSVDAYGRTTSIVSSAIAGLTVGQGGTGQSTFTTNGITYGNGTGPLQVTAAAGTSDQTWSNQILTVTNTGVPVWSTTMDGGAF